jgi:hypothetical protein
VAKVSKWINVIPQALFQDFYLWKASVYLAIPQKDYFGLCWAGFMRSRRHIGLENGQKSGVEDGAVCKN